jgi:hypothetical protein
MDEVEKLIGELENESWINRCRVCQALGKLKDARAIPALVETLDDDDRNVRWRAAEALGDIGNPIVFFPLIKASFDKDRMVRAHATSSIERIMRDCNSTKDIVESEKILDKNLKRKNLHRDFMIAIAKLKITITKRKNQLAQDKGIHLDNKPKPPKGNKIYNQVRRVRNGV